eukprot:425969-Pleurochrysis_carterae.AAC.2
MLHSFLALCPEQTWRRVQYARWLTRGESASDAMSAVFCQRRDFSKPAPDFFDRVSRRRACSQRGSLANQAHSKQGCGGLVVNDCREVTDYSLKTGCQRKQGDPAVGFEASSGELEENTRTRICITRSNDALGKDQREGRNNGSSEHEVKFGTTLGANHGKERKLFYGPAAKWPTTRPTTCGEEEQAGRRREM